MLLVIAMLFNIVALASCSGAGDNGGNTGDGGNSGNNGDNNSGNTGGLPSLDDIQGALDQAGYKVPEYDGSEVTITFYHTMSATTLQPTLDLYITEFNKLYPNIHVEHKAVGGYDDVVDQISKELTAGNQPNIAYCYPDHVAIYNIARAVVPLDNFIASTATITDALGNTSTVGFTQEQVDDFVPGYYAEGGVYDDKGTMYTLPLSKSTEALYYNKTFFENCQKIYTSDIELDINGNIVYLTDDNGEFILDTNGQKQTKPNPNKGNETYNIKIPTTWDEMEAVCKKILTIDPTCVPLGRDSESNWFITMCEQYAKDGESLYTSIDKNNHFLFDNDTVRSFVEKFANWYREGYVTTEALHGSYTSSLFTAKEGQRCYMVIGSTGGASYQNPPKDGNGKPMFETAMATIPQVDPANPKVISQGPSLCIFKDENPQEVIASWLFVKFITSNPGFQAQFSMMSGYAPVIKSVKNNPVYQDWLNKANGYDNLTAMSVSLALSQEDAYYVSPAFNGSSAARKQVGLVLSNVMADESGKPLKEVIDAEIKRALSECNYAVNGK